MPIDIQVLSSTLLNVMQTQMQQSFNTTCLPAFDSTYIDHVDVTAGTAAVTSSGAVDFTLPVEVYFVNMGALLASVNGTPAGATSPMEPASIVLTLTLSGTTLTLACTDVTLGAAITSLLGSTVAGLVSVAIKGQIGTVGSADLSSIFSSLRLPTPSTSALVQSGTSLFIRFDESGSPVDNLQTGQDWCLFVDAATMQSVSATQTNNTLAGISLITSHTTTAVWAPSGSVPHVNVTVNGKVTVPDPLDGDFTLTLGIDFEIGGKVVDLSIVSYLAEMITWNWDASTGLGSGDTKEEAKVQALFNSTGFGGTIISSNEFEDDQDLPSITLGNAVFQYGSPVGLPAGMVLGGAVTGIVTPDTNLVSFGISEYSDEFTLLSLCQGGSPLPTLGNVAALASASYADAGKLCSVTLLSPNPPPVDLSPYLNISPPPGSVTDTGSISLDFNGLVSQALAKAGQPVEFLVQTTRGVRVISFGVPPAPKFGSMGNVTNYVLVRINNCPIAVDPWYQVFQNFNPLWNVDPPESWVETVDQVAAFETSIITVAGLEPGELVTFNQPLDGGLSVMSADINGLAVLPVMLAVRSSDEHAVLSRASRGALGNLTITSMFFQRAATLNTPGAVSHQLSGTPEDATITTTYLDGSTRSVLVCGYGVSKPYGIQSAPHGNQPAANARPASAASSTDNLASAAVMPAAASSTEIPGLVKILTVPGFEKAPVTVAKLSDGTYLALSRHTDRPARVAGLIARWPDLPPVSGGWAISSATGDRIAVFAVRRTASPRCSCGCHNDLAGKGEWRFNRHRQGENEFRAS